MRYFDFTNLTDAVNDDDLRKVVAGTYSDSWATDVSSFDVESAAKLPLLLRPYSQLRTPAGVGQYLSYKDVSGNAFIATHATITAPAGSCPFKVGQLFVARTVATGSIAAAFKLTTPGRGPKGAVLLGPSDHLDPNDFPIPARPFANQIPIGSQRVLVGLGWVPPTAASSKNNPGGVLILYDQYWRVGPSSFPLAAGEKKTIVLTYRAGVSETSSTETTIGAYLGIDVSGGWGPISASISASITANQTVAHSRTLTESTESTTEIQLDNDRDQNRVVIYWQLVDSYTLVGVSDGAVLGAIENIQAPPLVQIYPPFGVPLRVQVDPRPGQS